jgi:hypothetical protein
MNYLRIFLGVCIVALAMFGLGYWQGKQGVPTSITEIKQEERVVYKDRIVTVIKTQKPDGTIVEETRTEDREGVKESSSNNKEQIAAKSPSQYKLGVSYQFDYNELLEKDTAKVFVTGSRRIIGPVWLDVQASSKSSLLGISWEF